MSRFSGLTSVTCHRALSLVLPVIESGLFKRDQGHLVVINPAIPYEPKYRNGPADEKFDDVVLFDRNFGGDPETWDGPYKDVARSKAFISWKTGLPSHRVQQEAPYLYEPGMTKWGGSAVAPGGLVVAFSGVEWFFDQMISEIMVAAIKATCLSDMREVMADSNVNTIGEDVLGLTDDPREDVDG